MCSRFRDCFEEQIWAFQRVEAPARQQQVAASTQHVPGQLFELLSLCLPFVHLTNVVKLSSSSRLLARLCREQLTASHNHLAHTLLQEALKDYAASSHVQAHNLQQKRLEPHCAQTQLVLSVAWLLGTLSTTSLFKKRSPHSAAEEATTADLLIHTCSSFMPIRLAKRLILSGMPVGYRQLAAAARAGATGIQVWGEALQQLRMDGGIPCSAKAFVFGNVMQSHEWWGPDARMFTAAELLDYCFLAGHCLTVKNMHKYAVDALERAFSLSMLKSVEWAAADVVSLLKMVSRNVSDQWQRGELQVSLMWSSGAKQMTVEMLVGQDGLLNAAFSNKDDGLMHLLVGKNSLKHGLIPAAKHIDAETLTSLLQRVVAIAPRNAGRPRDSARGRKLAAVQLAIVLVHSPLAEGISGEAAFELLQQAIGIKNEGIFENLYKLPAVQQLPYTAMRMLIDQANKMTWYNAALDLVSFSNSVNPCTYSWLEGL